MSQGGPSGYLNAVCNRSAVPSTSHCVDVSAVPISAVHISAVPISAVPVSSFSSAISASPGASPTSLFLFNEVYASGVPNHKGCRIAIPHSKLNISLWREKLVGYSDYVICDFLEFGLAI